MGYLWGNVSAKVSGSSDECRENSDNDNIFKRSFRTAADFVLFRNAAGYVGASVEGFAH